VPAFAELLDQIKHLEKNRFQTRAFAYLDVISWLEAKLSARSLEKVIREKYLQSRHR
jgi:RNase P/RNase MRP subunit POP5